MLQIHISAAGNKDSFKINIITNNKFCLLVLLGLYTARLEKQAQGGSQQYNN